jgi:hypothetical protein
MPYLRSERDQLPASTGLPASAARRGGIGRRIDHRAPSRLGAGGRGWRGGRAAAARGSRTRRLRPPLGPSRGAQSRGRPVRAAGSPRARAAGDRGLAAAALDVLAWPRGHRSRRDHPAAGGIRVRDRNEDEDLPTRAHRPRRSDRPLAGFAATALVPACGVGRPLLGANAWGSTRRGRRARGLDRPARRRPALHGRYSCETRVPLRRRGSEQSSPEVRARIQRCSLSSLTSRRELANADHCNSC